MEKGEGRTGSRLSPEARSLYIDMLYGRSSEDALSPQAMELASREFIEPDPIELGKWTPVDPREASASRAVRAARMLRSAVDDLTDLLEPDAELVAEYRAATGSSSSELERIPNPAMAGARIRRLAESCGGEILSAQPLAMPRPGEKLEASRNAEAHLLSKAGMRVLYPAHVRTSRAHREQARLMADKGCPTRTMIDDFPRMFILGELHAVVEDPRGPRPAPGVARAAVILHEPSLVAHLRNQFDALWESATPFTGRERYAAGEVELTARQFELLRHFVEGRTRPQIAKRMELSESWVDKEIARLRTTVRPGRDVGLVGLGFWFREYLSRHGMA